jgi:proton-dependent oligopeptide transporter, POT family
LRARGTRTLSRGHAPRLGTLTMSDAVASIGPDTADSAPPLRKRHPAGLYVLFFSETWAHFSFFGMQALLVYYMTKHLAFDQPTSSTIYGLYTAAAYFTPFFGGMLADRVLGQRLSVIIGGLAMALGHFMMAFEALFFPALVLIALGNGAYVPPLTAQVGRLYREGDPKRDQAYSLYYMGINIGGFLAPLVCGTLGEVYGWHYGFGAAGVGMVIGIGIYLLGQRTLPPDLLATRKADRVIKPLTAEEWSGLRALIAIAALVILFRIAYEQSGNTIALWVDSHTDRLVTFGDWSFLVPATWFQSINPLLIFTLTPFFIFFWSRQAARGKEPPTLKKMAIGCGIVALAYLVMVVAAIENDATQQPVSWAWVTAYFVLLTIGELYVLPIGLSAFSRLAPAQATAAVIGVWFLAKFAGSLLAGHLGTYWLQIPHPAFFLIGAGAAALAGIALLLFRAIFTRRIPSL